MDERGWVGWEREGERDEENAHERIISSTSWESEGIERDITTEKEVEKIEKNGKNI